MSLATRTIFSAALTLPALALATAAGLAQEASQRDIAAGREIAQRWCASCHVEDAATASQILPEVPTFTAIAGRRDMTTDRLVAALVAPHPPMPEMSLTRQEIAAVVAYIESLAP